MKASVAQSVERLPCKQRGEGAIPSRGSNNMKGGDKMAEVTICDVGIWLADLVKGCDNFRCLKEKIEQEGMKCRQQTEHTTSGPTPECPTCK